VKESLWRKTGLDISWELQDSSSSSESENEEPPEELDSPEDEVRDRSSAGTAWAGNFKKIKVNATETEVDYQDNFKKGVTDQLQLCSSEKARGT
jgi:hypothetical protein